MIFQFQTQYPERAQDGNRDASARLREAFSEKLNNFLSQLRTDFRYAVEVRNREFLTAEYFQMLASHNVAHVFNHWTQMPSIGEQIAIEGSLSADHIVMRILTPLGVAYKQAVADFFPYNELKRPMETMRRDVADLAVKAIKLKKKAYAIVNNRAEGNAPGTIAAIDAMIRKGIE